jgi:hypothetical protein
VLTNKEPVPEPALEVLEGGIAHEVAVLTVLQWAISPAGAVEGVIVHGDDVHDEGSEVPRQNPLGYLYSPMRRNGRKHVNKGSQVTVPNHVTIHIQTYRRGWRGGTDQVAAVEAVKRALASRLDRRDGGRAPLGDASSCDRVMLEQTIQQRGNHDKSGCAEERLLQTLPSHHEHPLIVQSPHPGGRR